MWLLRRFRTLGTLVVGGALVAHKKSVHGVGDAHAWAACTRVAAEHSADAPSSACASQPKRKRTSLGKSSAPAASAMLVSATKYALGTEREFAYNLRILNDRPTSHAPASGCPLDMTCGELQVAVRQRRRPSKLMAALPATCLPMLQFTTMSRRTIARERGEQAVAK